MSSPLDELVPRLVNLPGVVAVTLGGSRVIGTERPGSDWDFGLYYRGSFDASHLAALGYPSHVAQPGKWGPIANGGAWLRVGDEAADVLLRDLLAIERVQRNAELGRFEVVNVEGHLASVPEYVLLAEVALSRGLFGRLPEVEFPSRLREAASRKWRWGASFSMYHAAAHARRGDRTACTGMLAQAAIQEAHARLAAEGEWTLNEKGLLARAGLGAVDDALRDAPDLTSLVTRVGGLLGATDVPELSRLGRYPVELT